MDTAWAQQHRSRLRLFFVVIGTTMLVTYLGVSLYTPPTCYDGKQNHSETGPDCGGVCSLMCVSETQELHTVWARPFKVSEGWYSAVAYVENANFNAKAEDVPYRFQFYDEKGQLIAERTGSTFLTRDPVTAIFAGRVDTKNRDVFRTTFEWLQRPIWHRDERALYQVSFEEQDLVPSRTGQDLYVIAHNQESTPLTDVRVVAILYDQNKNAIASSETYIDLLLPRSRRKITFSWPERFAETPARIEIIPRIPAQE